MEDIINKVKPQFLSSVINCHINQKTERLKFPRGKGAHSVMISPSTRELSTRLQFLLAAQGLPHLSRWKKSSSPKFRQKKEIYTCAFKPEDTLFTVHPMNGEYPVPLAQIPKQF
jgi:hypothetical protein